VGINLDRPSKPIVAALRTHRILSGASAGNPNQIRLLPPLTLTEAEAEPFAVALASVLAETAVPEGSA
jgi:acetylornithine/succinyldiaminopimelate/putrescine aminotransferase